MFIYFFIIYLLNIISTRKAENEKDSNLFKNINAQNLGIYNQLTKNYLKYNVYYISNNQYKIKLIDVQL